MKSRKSWLYIFLISLAAILLIPLIRILVHYIIIEPVSYYWWGIKRGLALVPQYFYWIFLVSGLGMITVIFLLKHLTTRKQDSITKRNSVGPVESLSDTILRTKDNNYLKWIIANKLAIMTITILDPSNLYNLKKRSSANQNILFKNFPGDIRNYLQTGTDSSFSNIHYTKKIPNIKQKNPHLNIKIEKVVDYLETLME